MKYTQDQLTELFIQAVDLFNETMDEEYKVGDGGIMLRFFTPDNGIEVYEDFCNTYEKDSAKAKGTLIATETVHFTAAEVSVNRSFTGLDANKFYYIRFFNNSNSKASSSMDISGTIEVDDVE